MFFSGGKSTNQKGMFEFLKMEAASSLVFQCSEEQNFNFFIFIWFFSVRYLKTEEILDPQLATSEIKLSCEFPVSALGA